MQQLTFEAAFEKLPLIAILRGLPVAEAGTIGSVLVEAGVVLIEIPLNTHDAINGIKALQAEVGNQAVVGAGTVLSTDAVDQISAAGARFAVAPNTNPAVIRRAKAAGLVMIPGVATASEMFAALDAGADLLKLFPTDCVPPPAVRALREVAPAGTRMVAVGNLDLKRLQAYREAGVVGVGLGRAIYTPELAPAEVADRATRIARYWRDGS